MIHLIGCYLSLCSPHLRPTCTHPQTSFHHCYRRLIAVPRKMPVSVTSSWHFSISPASLRRLTCPPYSMRRARRRRVQPSLLAPWTRKNQRVPTLFRRGHDWEVSL